MSERRRILKVKNKFQDRMILEILLLMFILLNVMVIISFYTLETIPDLYDLKLTLAGALAVGESGAILIVYNYTLRASHKIAGPIYILERNLRRMADGDLTVDIHLRDGDHFMDTAEVMNHCAGQLRSRIGSMQDHARQLREQLASEGRQSDHLDALLEHLDRFRTTPADTMDDNPAEAAAEAGTTQPA